jgi:hypothetical protein
MEPKCCVGPLPDAAFFMTCTIRRNSVAIKECSDFEFFANGQRRERLSSVRMQGFVNEGPKDGRAKVLLSLGEL